MHILDVLRDRVDDDMDLLQIYYNEVLGFEDAYCEEFEANLHYNSNNNEVKCDSVQISAAIMMNKESRNERLHNSVWACHEYAAFVQYVKHTQAAE